MVSRERAAVVRNVAQGCLVLVLFAAMGIGLAAAILILQAHGWAPPL